MKPVSTLERLAAIAAGSSGPINISARDAREIGLDCPGACRLIGAAELQAAIDALRAPTAPTPEVTAPAETEDKPKASKPKAKKPEADKPESDEPKPPVEAKPE